MKKFLIASAFSLLMLVVLAPQAEARGRFAVSVGVGVGGYYGPYAYYPYPPPVVYYPAPVVAPYYYGYYGPSAAFYYQYYGPVGRYRIYGPHRERGYYGHEIRGRGRAARVYTRHR